MSRAEASTLIWFLVLLELLILPAVAFGQDTACGLFPVNIAEDYLDATLLTTTDDQWNCVYKDKLGTGAQISLKIDGPYDKKTAKINYLNSFNAARSQGARRLIKEGNIQAFFLTESFETNGISRISLLSSSWLLDVNINYITGGITKSDAAVLLKRHILRKFRKYQKNLLKMTGGVQSCKLEDEAPQPDAIIEATKINVISGESTTISWSGWEACRCDGGSYSAVGGATQQFDTHGATRGSVTVSPTETTSYSLACFGPGGSDYTSVLVRVSGILPDDSNTYFFVDRYEVKRGEFVTLTVSAPSPSGADPCLEQDFLFDEKSFSDGRFTGKAKVQVNTTRTFIMTCGVNRRELTVKVAP